MRYYLITIITLISTMISCKSDEIANYTVGSEFLENEINLKQVDSLTLKTSTFIIDSISTTGTGRVLLGHINDDDLGPFTSSSFLQLSAYNFSFADIEAVYDSARLVLNYDSYYIGDTTQIQNYKVYPITEAFEPEEDLFYKDSELDYDSSNLLGELSFFPTPTYDTDTVDDVFIEIDDTYGESVFNSLYNETATDNDEFTALFPGIVIIPDNSSTSILGFNTNASVFSSDNTSLRVYYTTTAGISDYVDFPVINAAKQFNAYTTDLSASEISVIEGTTDQISSEDTNDITYIQSGSGISTKIEVPFLRNLIDSLDFASSLSAELTFNPSEEAFNNNILQDSLIAYIVDENNALESILTDIDGITTYATLSGDTSTYTDTYYSLDVGNFIDEVLADETKANYSLLLQTRNPSNTIEKQILDGEAASTSKLKLTVKYLNY